MTELNGIVLSRLPVLPLRGLTAFPEYDRSTLMWDSLMSIRALEAAMKNGQTHLPDARSASSKPIRPTPSDLYQIGTICQIQARSCVCRAIMSGCWSRARPVHSRHNFIAAEKDEDCMYAEVEELEDYVSRRDRNAGATGTCAHRAGALQRISREYASRLSPDVELTVAEGGDPGYLADYIAQNIPVDVAVQAGDPRRAWHYPPPGDGDSHAR